jgi:integrase
MATVKFIVRASTKKGRRSVVHLRLRHGRQTDLTTSTPMVIDYNQWNPKTQQPRQNMDRNERLEFTSRLSNLQEHILKSLNATNEPITKTWLKQRVHEYFYPDKEINEQFLLDYVRRFIREAERGERKFLKKSSSGKQWLSYKRTTVRQYRSSVEERIKEYEKKRKVRLTFNDITMEFYYDYLLFMEEITCRTNTIGNAIKNLKKIMGAAEREGLHRNPVYRSEEFIKPSEETENIYLNEDEIRAIYNLKFEDNEKDMEKHRDVFLVGCYTALRFSDYSRISRVHIAKTGGGVKVVKIETTKTQQPVEIPIRPELDYLLRKYNYTLPHTYEQYLNRDIKNIARRAGITDPVRITELKNGMKVDRPVEKCTRISTHTARRSGATNMYKAGIPSISIMKITGHTTEASFLKYICIDREENAEMLYNNQFFNGKFKKVD